MLLVRVNTESLWKTNLSAYAFGCESPVGGGMIEEGVGVEKNCKNTVHDCKMLGKIFSSKQCKVG